MRGRKEPCKDNIGGIRKVYFMDYVKYPKRLIPLNDEKTEILAFPVTIIYDFELRTDTAFDQDINEEERSIYYDQRIELPLKRDSLTTLNEVRTLSKKELRLIVEDHSGQYYMMGVYNGCNISGYDRSTGGAKSDFNGYTLTVEAKEELPALFIENLEYTGFIPPLEGKTLWLASDDTIYASNDTKLISELYL